MPWLFSNTVWPLLGPPMNLARVAQHHGSELLKVSDLHVAPSDLLAFYSNASPLPPGIN